jgi:methyltransferase
VVTFKKISLIRILALWGVLGVPFFAYIFYMSSEKKTFETLFFIFFIFHSIERVWETFYTSREKRAFELHGDWTLVVTTIAYIILCLIVITDVFLFSCHKNVLISQIGFLTYLMAFVLRWWGIKSLGSQWAVHAVGVKKIASVSVVKKGPYRYIRHPIYAAIFLEVASIPLMANSVMGILYALFFYIPLQYIRLLEEEKNNVRKMGNEYLNYVKQTNKIIPFKSIFKNNQEEI